MEHRKYQWSIKLDDGQIYVVQEDTFKDLQLAKDEVMSAIKNSKMVDDEPEWLKDEKTSNVVPTPKKDTGVCGVHGVDLKLNKLGNPYHREWDKDKGTRFCNGEEFGEWKK